MKQRKPKFLLEQPTQQTAKQEDSLSSSIDYTQFVLVVVVVMVVYHTHPTRKSWQWSCWKTSVTANRMTLMDSKEKSRLDTIT